VSIVLR